nr:hypothetical protein [Tanacetum cinerariifolium]
MAQTLIEIKAAKPKVITIAATIVIAAGTRPKEKGIVMQEPFETPSPKPIDSSQLPSKSKDKGKGKMVKPKKPLKRKDQIMIDEEIEAFIPMEAELVKENNKAIEGSEKAKEGSSKRARENLEQEDAKRLRLKEKNESAKLKRCLEIVPEDDDDATIEATPLFSKSLTIFYYKIYKEKRKSYFKIIRADGNSQNYLTFRKILKTSTERT